MPYLSKYGDPREDPESFRRKASGFWDRHYNMETATETWSCDKGKLNKKVAEAMLDPDFARAFHTQGIGILDRMFGEGTSEAFRYKSKHDRVQMRFNIEKYQDRYGIDPARGRDMARGFNNYHGTTSGTAATNTNTFTNTNASSKNWFDDQQRKVVRKAKVKAPTKNKGFRFDGDLRLNGVPFKIESGGTLLGSLQRQFDIWTKSQLRLVRG